MVFHFDPTFISPTHEQSWSAPTFMALISDTLHMVQNLLLYYLLNLTQKVKTLTHSLRPHDPISFLWLQYCLHFHSLFFISLPPSLIPCMFPTTNVHKNHHNKKWKMHTNFVPIFFLLCGALDAQVPFASTLLANGTNHKTPSLKFKRRKK